MRTLVDGPVHINGFWWAARADAICPYTNPGLAFVHTQPLRSSQKGPVHTNG
jgi:hypothetical protein